MILADKRNDAQLLALAPSIQHYMNEWQIVNINILKDSVLTQEHIVERLLEQYNKFEGLIYPTSDKKIMMLVRLGIVHNPLQMKSEIEGKMPNHCCRVLIRKMSAVGMKQVQIDLMERDNAIKLVDNLFYQRQNRKENILMVADDDKFMRLSMLKLLGTAGTLVEAQNSAEVMGQYLRHNPDIIFLDIHMPGKSGLELIRDIMGIDSDAFIVVLSADSSAENVIKALEEGAVGFLSKPPVKEKVQDYIRQCLTVK